MNAITKMSVKGQVVIPKDVRDALDWPAGIELTVIRSREGVTLRPATARRERISIEEFKRRLPKYEGPAYSFEEWDEAVAEMFRREWK